jgi:hypothetical protein
MGNASLLITSMKTISKNRIDKAFDSQKEIYERFPVQRKIPLPDPGAATPDQPGL